MTIENASLAIGATWAPTGGSATSLLKRTSRNNELVAFLDDGSVLAEQTELTFSVTPQRSSPGKPDGYTQARNNVFVNIPTTTGAASEVTHNTIKVAVSRAHDTSAADVTAMRSLLAHIAQDSDFDEFWDNLSVG